MSIKLLGFFAVAALSALSVKAANTALDTGLQYQNPWGPANPQFLPNSGFASWFFDQWNPFPQTPAKTPFFINRSQFAWGINVPAATDNSFAHQGYDAAWISFTGDGHLDAGQRFVTSVYFTVPGPFYGGAYGTVATPTEGVDFFAQSSTVPSQYDSFGHQVIGLYLGPSPSGPVFTFVVHPTVSDENPPIVDKSTPLNKFISAANTPNNPLYLLIIFSQGVNGQWDLQIQPLSSPGAPINLSSRQYGLTWNKAPSEGLDAVRYFCSQGGVTPGGPLEWGAMAVR
jgi:hypothetical protein